MTMARKKGSKQIEEGRRKTICDIFKGRMKTSMIADVLKTNYRTVYGIIRKHKIPKLKAKRGRKHNLCARSLRRLRRQIDYEPFKHLSVRTAEFY